MIPELRNHILSFLSSDSLLPPSLLELSRLLQRPTLDLIVLRREDASPHVCSYEGFVYTGPMWIVRVTRSELRQVRTPEYIGYRLTSLVPGVSTVITKVYSKLRGRACAWETLGLFRAQLLVPVSQADEEYLQAWQARHGHTWPRMQKDHPEVLRLLRKHEDWVRTTWEERLPL